MCRTGGQHHALTKQKEAEKNKCSVAYCSLYERLRFSELKHLLLGLRVTNQKTPWCTGRWWKKRKNRNICCVTDAEAWRATILGPYLWQTIETEGPEEHHSPQLALLMTSGSSPVTSSPKNLKSVHHKCVQTQPWETGFIVSPPRKVRSGTLTLRFGIRSLMQPMRNSIFTSNWSPESGTIFIINVPQCFSLSDLNACVCL